MKWASVSALYRGLCVHWRPWAVLGAMALTSVTGCVGETQLRAGLLFDYPVTYVHRPPPRVRYYPRTVYRGRPAYLVHGRWYYSSPRGWVVFRGEPRELRGYRLRYYGERGRSSPERYRDDRDRRRHDERRRYRSRDTELESPHESRRRRYPQ